MPDLLLTGFEPFLDFKINPSQEIVKELSDTVVGPWKIHGLVLPVDYEKSFEPLREAIDRLSPKVVVSLGVAAGRNRITPERVAINCNDGAKDNQGVQLTDQPIEPEGPAAYFSTLPIRTIVNRLKEAGIPAVISNSAGTYLCNNVMYQTLHYIATHGLSIRAGFIHVPATYEMVIDSLSTPAMPLETLKNAIRIAIETVEWPGTTA